MRTGLTGGAIAVILIIAVIIGYGTFFTVDQTSQALVVRLGKPVRVITDPGLDLKVPFIDSVIYIDKRILAIESPAQEVIASSQDNSTAAAQAGANAGAQAGASVGAQAGERLVVDAFARYSITDPLKFYQTVGPLGANSQLSILLNSTLRQVLGEATLADVVRNKRDALMAQMRSLLDQKAAEFGIQVVDVRIRRADLPEQNSEAVYKRMQTERQREAAEFRGEGSQKAQGIRAKADRDVTVIVADANSQAEIIRGQGDAESNATFAQAYGQDPGFFAFYRSMRAYEQSLQHGNTNLVLGPDSDFFRYFGDPSGRAPVEAGAAPAKPAQADAHARAAASAAAR
jgi:modulator of FtsH protease HflC